MSGKLKRRPKGILDVYRTTTNSKAVKEEFFRENTRRKLNDERTLRETIQKEIKTRQNFVALRFEEESKVKSLVEAKQHEREAVWQKQQQVRLRNQSIAEREREKLAEENMLKRKEQILNNSEDYHDFRRQIRMAETAREQTKQINDKLMGRSHERETELQERRNYEEQLKRQDDSERNRTWAAKMQKQDYQTALLNQMEKRRELQRNEEAEEKSRDKKLLADTRKKEEIEQQRDHQLTLERKNETRRFYEEYLTSHKERMERERQKANQEMQKAQEYDRRQQERERHLQLRTDESQQRHEDLIDKVSRIMIEENERHGKEEKERTSRQGSQLQKKQRKEQQREYQLEREKRQKAHTAIFNQLKRREEQLYRELAEEQRYRQKIQAEVAMSSELTRQQKDEKQLEYLRELQRMMDDLKERKIQDRKMEDEFFQRKVERDREVDDEVTMEKQRLLKNQMADLWGYLPKSILRTTARSARSQT